MKKLLAAVSIAAVSTSVLADPHRSAPPVYHYKHNPGHGHWVKRDHHWEWVIPAVIGGVIVYEATRPRVTPLTDPNLKVCSPWTEIQNPDGTITRTRTCSQ